MATNIFFSNTTATVELQYNREFVRLPIDCFLTGDHFVIKQWTPPSIQPR